MFAFNASMAQVGDFYVPLTNPGGGIYGFGTEFSFKVAPTLIASFNYQPASPVVGQAVQFTDTSTGSPTSWQWSFGDGTTSTAQNPAHTFTTAASYTVTLTVTNASGSNNVSQTVAIALPPDLRIWGISPQPGFPKSTDIITFYVEVRNNGAGPAGASTARLVVGSLTYYLPISTLAAGTSQTVTQAVGPLANGMYPVTGTADVNNDVFESNETNNQASFNLGVGPPDLVVESVTYSPANPKSTDPISVYVVIRNQGYQRADLSTMSLYIEGKGTINYGVDYIYVNDTYTVYASVGTLSAGTHAVTATADVNNVVAELDEENNVYTGSITVTAPPLPDLTEGLFKDEPPPQGRLAILSSWLMSKTSGSDWLAHQRRN
jgi:PKD repeat protein